MNKIRQLSAKLQAKAIAVFLVILTSIIGMCNINLFFAAEKENLFETPLNTYDDSMWCCNITYDYIYDFTECYKRTGSFSEAEQAAAKGSDNLAFEVIDDTGKLVYFRSNGKKTGCTKQSSCVVSDIPDPKGTNHRIKLEPPQQYAITAYVADPITTADNYFFTYRMFRLLETFKYTFFPITGICFLICLTAVVFLILDAGHQQGKKDILLNWQDKIPLDIYILLWGCFFSLLKKCFDIFISNTSPRYNHASSQYYITSFDIIMLFIFCSLIT